MFEGIIENAFVNAGLIGIIICAAIILSLILTKR